MMGIVENKPLNWKKDSIDVLHCASETYTIIP